MLMALEVTGVIAKSFGGTTGSRPEGGVMANGCISQKKDHWLRGFFTHVMHNAAFLSIMQHS